MKSEAKRISLCWDMDIEHFAIGNPEITKKGVHIIKQWMCFEKQLRPLKM